MSRERLRADFRWCGYVFRNREGLGGHFDGFNGRCLVLDGLAAVIGETVIERGLVNRGRQAILCHIRGEVLPKTRFPYLPLVPDRHGGIWPETRLAGFQTYVLPWALLRQEPRAGSGGHPAILAETRAVLTEFGPAAMPAAASAPDQRARRSCDSQGAEGAAKGAGVAGVAPGTATTAAGGAIAGGAI